MHDPKVKPEKCATPGCHNEVPSYQIGSSTFYAPLCEECQRLVTEQQEDAFWAATRRRFDEETWRTMCIPPRFFEEDFTTFSVLEGNRKAYDAAILFAGDYSTGRETGGLILIGGKGVGKTHLACAILKAVKDGLLVTQSDLMADVRAEWQRDHEHYVGFRDRAIEAAVLVLDDMVPEPLNESQSLWLRDVVYRIVNTRWGEKLPTVVTSNSTMADFEKRLGAPIVSRLLDGAQVVSIEDRDHRIRR